MNAFVKTALVIAFVVALSVAANVAIPQTFTFQINSSIIYFMSFLNSMSWLVHTDTIFNCASLLLNFAYGVMLFYVGKWLVHLIA